MSVPKTPLLSAKQVAERLNISVRLAHKLMPEMHPVNVSAGSKNAFLRVKESELDAWISRRVKELEPTAAPALVLLKPRKPKPSCAWYPQPINGRIPTRKEAQEQLRVFQQRLQQHG